jgi:hypothetical protein
MKEVCGIIMHLGLHYRILNAFNCSSYRFPLTRSEVIRSATFNNYLRFASCFLCSILTILFIAPNLMTSVMQLKSSSYLILRDRHSSFNSDCSQCACQVIASTHAHIQLRSCTSTLSDNSHTSNHRIILLRSTSLCNHSRVLSCHYRWIPSRESERHSLLLQRFGLPLAATDTCGRELVNSSMNDLEMSRIRYFSSEMDINARRNCPRNILNWRNVSISLKRLILNY